MYLIFLFRRFEVDFQINFEIPRNKSDFIDFNIVDLNLTVSE